MSRMNIVQISLDEDVFNKNAAQDSRARQISYAKSLKNINDEYHLVNIVLTENRKLQREELDDVTFYPCNCYRLRHIVSLVLFLKNIHKKNNIVILTTQDFHGIFWGAVLFSRFDKVPVIGQIHYDLSSLYARNEWFLDPYGPLYERVALWLAKAFNGMRVVNSATKLYLENSGYKNPVSVCPVLVTTYLEHKNETTNNWKHQGALRVLYVGRFVKFKNLDCWLETAQKAWSENSNIEFTLIGDGEERARIENYCKVLAVSSRVQFIGALKPEQLVDWYSSADVFLLTSIYEGFGRVIVEAMNYNVVPVSSNVAGPEDIINHGVDGFLDEADPERLAKRLISLEENREMLEKMAHSAKVSVKEKYQPEKLKENWLNFLLSFS